MLQAVYSLRDGLLIPNGSKSKTHEASTDHAQSSHSLVQPLQGGIMVPAAQHSYLFCHETLKYPLRPEWHRQQRGRSIHRRRRVDRNVSYDDIT